MKNTCFLLGQIFMYAALSTNINNERKGMIPMKKLFSRAITGMMTAAAAVTLCLSASAAGLSPSTGEQKNMLPFILAGVGLLAVLAIVALTVLEQKKKSTPPQAAPSDIAPKITPETTPGVSSETSSSTSSDQTDEWKDL
jgi:hypothetical protein